MNEALNGGSVAGGRGEPLAVVPSGCRSLGEDKGNVKKKRNEERKGKK
jgi:hypothetical protein